MKVYYQTSVMNSYFMGMLLAVLIIPGIAMIAFDGNILGALPILLWVFLLSLSKGTKIDFEKKQISFFILSSG